MEFTIPFYLKNDKMSIPKIKRQANIISGYKKIIEKTIVIQKHASKTMFARVPLTMCVIFNMRLSFFDFSRQIICLRYFRYAIVSMRLCVCDCAQSRGAPQAEQFALFPSMFFVPQYLHLT